MSVSACASILLSAAFVVASLVSACGGGSDESDDTEEHVQAQPDATAFDGTAVEAVESFDAEDVEESVSRLNEVIAADEVVIADLAPLLEADDTDQRWAALYLVAFSTETDEEIEVLTPMLEDDELSFRVIAAGSLFGVGVTEAFPVLVEGLSTEDFLPYSDPPRPVSALATETLEYYTGESFATPEEWESWFADVEESLTWDGDMYVAE